MSRRGGLDCCCLRIKKSRRFREVNETNLRIRDPINLLTLAGRLKFLQSRNEFRFATMESTVPSEDESFLTPSSRR